MSIVNKRVIFLGFLWTVGVFGNAQAAKKLVLDEETLEILDEEYRIFNERNFKKMADREVEQQIQHSTQSRELFQNLRSVVLPICDGERPPFEWRYVAQSEQERVLKFIGEQSDSQFLRWTDSVWVRIAGAKEKYRTGMFCGDAFAKDPSLENFIAVDIDKSFAENVKYRNTPTEVIDGTFLQLASKVSTDAARQMRAEVQIRVSAQRPIKVGLEIWSIKPSEIKMLSSVWKELDASTNASQKIAIEANVEANSQTHMVLRFHPKERDQMARGENSGRIYLMDARLTQIQ